MKGSRPNTVSRTLVITLFVGVCVLSAGIGAGTTLLFAKPGPVGPPGERGPVGPEGPEGLPAEEGNAAFEAEEALERAEEAEFVTSGLESEVEALRSKIFNLEACVEAESVIC